MWPCGASRENATNKDRARPAALGGGAVTVEDDPEAVIASIHTAFLYKARLLEQLLKVSSFRSELVQTSSKFSGDLRTVNSRFGSVTANSSNLNLNQ
jgi:hypothetical protein